MAIADRDIKALWGKAGAHCSYPQCQNDIVANTTNDILGHAAHIIARSPEGPRGDPSVPPEALDRYENLILLCPYHHTLVDGDTAKYTVEGLHRMKQEHESQIEAAFAMGDPWKCDVAQLYYVNVPRLAILAAISGQGLNFAPLDNVPNLHSLGFQLTSLLIQFEKTVGSLSMKALPLVDFTRLDGRAIGATFSFSRKFRTRGVPGPDDMKPGGFALKGDLAKDPQIYATQKGIRLVLPLDPRWITTSTAFVDFSPPGGIGDFAGQFTLKQSLETEKMAIGTPIVIGTPSSLLDALFSGAPMPSA